MKSLVILGSTGSIGSSTLDVVRRHRDRFKIVGLTARHQIHLLADQIQEIEPEVVCVGTPALAAELQQLLAHPPSLPKNRGELRRDTRKKAGKIEILVGEEGLVSLATHDQATLIVSALVGAVGLTPTLAAIRAKKNIALANKETLVVAGELMMKEAKKNHIRLLPVDSEHSALFQCLEGQEKKNLRKITLTASGGPFRQTPLSKLSSVTVADALRHPNWSMGKKITIDSATMMNKGLEVIEAFWLFERPLEQIEVVIHPQSIIHSFVEFEDSSVLAQLGLPDMRTPIAYALAYPERITSGVASLDLTKMNSLSFEPVDHTRFPCLRLASEAAKCGKSMPAVLNAANEIAVDAFLHERIRFLDIARIVEETMMQHSPRSWRTLEEILEIDREARMVAQTYI
ncbi:MAG: 1-deoxy-D-xylulose-5-phosphate reductoisomerase [Deltaproteobacteria bacterium RIFCSPLOWO2_02_FULL_44_10]|nr:MAG: 1-deoxy-D-xylulose-5-phosphate reductoisomerase [Deltaproteobacteria bacterium RIFCSPLOWO2_02_FULL_44_10]